MLKLETLDSEPRSPDKSLSPLQTFDGVLTAHDLGGLQCEVASKATTTAVMRGQTLSGDRGSMSNVLVCWPLDLGSTPDESLSFSFPLAFFGLCKSTSKVNTSVTRSTNKT